MMVTVRYRMCTGRISAESALPCIQAKSFLRFTLVRSQLKLELLPGHKANSPRCTTQLEGAPRFLSSSSLVRTVLAFNLNVVTQKKNPKQEGGACWCRLDPATAVTQRRGTQRAGVADEPPRRNLKSLELPPEGKVEEKAKHPSHDAPSPFSVVSKFILEEHVCN
jgi:hypothetical protein